MGGYNYTCQLGRLGKDPEVINTKNGKQVCKLSLANETGYKEHKETQWHRVTCFGVLAELCVKFLKKGDQAMISGEVRYNKYTNKDGNEVYGTDIIARDVTFLGSKKTESTDNTFENEAQSDVKIDDNVPF